MDRRYGERLQNVSSDFICSEVEWRSKDWQIWCMVMSFIYNCYGSMQENGVIHGEEWMSIRNDEMSKKISLYPIYSYVLYCQFS